MSHLDLRQAAAQAFLGCLLELARRLEPSSGMDYCEACDVPDLALPRLPPKMTRTADALMARTTSRPAKGTRRSA